MVHALSNVSLTVAQGEVLGLVGESASGKSTLVCLISGIYAPSDGGIRLHGRPVATRHRHQDHDPRADDPPGPVRQP
ncbi:ATP-binding cassette domain-containing protein [Salipiger sp. 1_MG-2023]|uniref:ATP-binding cassette domain-containing protein n=1 Tax=Salipiger sp. 1_MG-2023 TaxID=3062665 RepID=UPI0034C684AF